MATIEKYRSEIEKAKAKIGELQKKVRDLSRRSPRKKTWRLSAWLRQSRWTVESCLLS